MSKGPLVIGALVVISLIYAAVNFVRSHAAIDVFALVFIGLSLLSLFFMFAYVKAEAAK